MRAISWLQVRRGDFLKGFEESVKNVVDSLRLISLALCLMSDDVWVVWPAICKNVIIVCRTDSTKISKDIRTLVVLVEAFPTSISTTAVYLLTASLERFSLATIGFQPVPAVGANAITTNIVEFNTTLRAVLRDD